MNSRYAIAHRHHIFKDDDYSLTPIQCQTKISSGYKLYEAVNNQTDKKYYMLKSDSEFQSDDAKYTFINHAERATELIHPALFTLSGFSDQCANLYYEYYPGIEKPLSDEELSTLDDPSIQMIILGSISCLIYLMKNGFSIQRFTIDSIFFTLESGPKFINYVNYNLLQKDFVQNKFVEPCDGKKLVFQVGQLMRQLYCHKRIEEGSNEELKLPDNIDPTIYQYITSCNNLEDGPTLKDLYVNLSELYRVDPWIQNYLIKLDSADKYRYDYKMDQINYTPFRIYKDDAGYYYSNIHFDSNVNILHACYIQEDVFSHKEYFPLLNRLPDSEIKLLLQNQSNPPKQFYEFLCYDREYLLLAPELSYLFNSEKPEYNFLIYQKLMEKSKRDENPNQAIFPIALKHLKMAAKKNHKKAKIKLAVHYLKGDIVPSNIEKSLMWLKSVSFGNKEDVSKYVTPINEKMHEINAALDHLEQEHKNAIKKAEEGNPLYMLYVAFAFYSGIDNFPISPSKSVHYYREAAKKSPHFMCLLGGLYLQGKIFPRNLIRARNCFQKAALGGVTKAKILDNLMRKHVWRYYLSDVSIQTIYNSYTQCPESLSFDDSLIFPEINFLIENIQNQLLFTSPYMSSFYFYDRRNNYGSEKKKDEMKLAIKTIDFRIPTLPDEDILANEDIQVIQFYTYLFVISKLLNSNILPQQLNPLFHEEKENPIIAFAKSFLNNKFGFIFADDDDGQTDITKQNMKKFEISSDIESNFLSYIQHKYVPVEFREENINCATVSYVPLISLPIADDQLREIKKIIDNSFEKVMQIILDNDYDKYLPKHMNAPSNSIEDYIKNQESVLRITMKEHMQGNQHCQAFINEMNSFEVYNSEKIFYSSLTKEEPKPDDFKTQLYIANSYFYGSNNFPVNYTEAAKYYKMAADGGDAEAQWKFAQLQVNGLGVKQDGKGAQIYMKKSADQKDPDGMLRYGLFIRHFLINHGTKESIEWPSFQKYLENSAETGNLEAINQLGMILESNYCYESGAVKSITKYEDAVDKGLIGSVFRLLNIYYENPADEKKYRNLVKLSVGMCDHDILMRMIEINNIKKRFDQSGILINVGLCFDKDAFLPSYAKHIVLYSNNSNLKNRISYAKSLINPTLNNPSANVIEKGYLETYLMAMLTILCKANEYEEACQLFIKKMNCLTMKSKKEFIYFYMNINKKVARQYQLSINSYLPEYRACSEAFMLIKQKGIHVKEGYEKLKLILQENSSNQFALLKRGKILLSNHLFMRRNISKALDLIQKAAQQNCPEARFEYGKELYYGQTIPMNRYKAFKYFTKAFDITNRDPRAGYFLSKKCFIKRNLISQAEADECLKIACKSGYRRALFKLGKRFFFGKGNKSELGIILLKKARDQQYSKSIEFLNQYENADDALIIPENEEKAYFAFAKELYNGIIIAQDLQMSFRMFMKFFTSKEPDLRAGYFLSKKKFIQMGLITPNEARNALVISAKSHYKRALFKLGKLYYIREGKQEKGLNLLRKAKKQNYQKAIDFLKEIKNKQLKLNKSDESSVFIPQKTQQESPLVSDETDSIEYLVKKDNDNDNNVPLKEIIINENQIPLINAHKVGTSSNIKPTKIGFPMNLIHSSSKLTKSNDVNEPLLSDYNMDNNNNNTNENTNNETKKEKPKQKKIKLNEPVISDFSDEPPDDDE